MFWVDWKTTKKMFRLPTIAGCYSEQITNQNKKSVYKRPEKRCKFIPLFLCLNKILRETWSIALVTKCHSNINSKSLVKGIKKSECFELTGRQPKTMFRLPTNLLAILSKL